MDHPRTSERGQGLKEWLKRGKRYFKGLNIGSTGKEGLRRVPTPPLSPSVDGTTLDDYQEDASLTANGRLLPPVQVQSIGPNLRGVLNVWSSRRNAGADGSLYSGRFETPVTISNSPSLSAHGLRVSNDINVNLNLKRNGRNSHVNLVLPTPFSLVPFSDPSPEASHEASVPRQTLASEGPIASSSMVNQSARAALIADEPLLLPRRHRGCRSILYHIFDWIVMYLHEASS